MSELPANILPILSPEQIEQARAELAHAEEQKALEQAYPGRFPPHASVRELLPNELPRVGQPIFVTTHDGQTRYNVKQT
jgi:hypothetical protein